MSFKKRATHRPFELEEVQRGVPPGFSAGNHTDGITLLMQILSPHLFEAVPCLFAGFRNADIEIHPINDSPLVGPPRGESAPSLALRLSL